MGLSLLGALLALAFALLGQSPGLTQRLGLGGARLDLRVRSFTTYAFALLLLSIGFFLAGIPVDSPAAVAVGTTEPENSDNSPNDVAGIESLGTPLVFDAGGENSSEESQSAQATRPTAATSPESGSFGGPPPSSASVESEAEGEASSSESGSTGDESLSPLQNTETPRPSSTPTTIATPTPTQTPSPTITPTPLTGETAIISSGGSTVWITRSPGGQNLTLVRDGDTVLILSGHANQAGLLWREVRTVNGILGWVQETYLEYPE
jgi:hypothetical protein